MACVLGSAFGGYSLSGLVCTRRYAHRTCTSSKTKTRSRSKTHAHTLKTVHTYILENAHTHTRSGTHTRTKTQAFSSVPVNVCVCSLCVFLLRLVPHAIRPLFPSVALEPWIIVFFFLFYKTSCVFTLLTLRPFCVSCFYSAYRDLTCASHFYPSSCFRASSYACSVL